MRTFFIYCSIFISCCIIETAHTEEATHYQEKRVILAGGIYYRHQVQHQDPITALTQDAITEIKAAKKVEFNAYIPAYIDSIEQYYIDQGYPNKEFLDWLKAHPDIRNAFWPAINPSYDDAKAAINILDQLRRERTEACIENYHFSIAMALVADAKDAIASSRHFLVWGVQESQMLSMPDMLEIFDYYTDPKNQKLFLFKPKQLVWPLLVHLVDFDLNTEERAWVINNMAQARANLAKTYSMVEYDYNKLNRKPKLGSKPYSLENLFNPGIGGVCVDQAHCSSRVMKCFGVPALKVRGDGRYGGSGHAWTGFLNMQGKQLRLDFTGRYFNDYYWTGDAFDPQTQSLVLDRHLAMMLDGALVNYKKFIDSSILTRMALKLEETHPDLSAAICNEALELNPYNKDLWDLIARHYISERYDDKDLKKKCKTLFKELQHHPDITYSFVEQIMQKYLKDDFKKRHKLYHTAYTIYKERPDLQVQLRKLQCAELFDEKKAEMGLDLALDTVVKNASEGTLVLPLVEQLVTGLQDYDKKIQAKAYAILDKTAETTFPKKRGSKTSAAYTELRRLISTLQ